MYKDKFKNSIGDSISNLIGTDGFRTDVNIKLDATTIAILVLVIPITVAAGILLAGAIAKKLK
jgi:hypothetical protein